MPGRGEPSEGLVLFAAICAGALIIALLSAALGFLGAIGVFAVVLIILIFIDWLRRRKVARETHEHPVEAQRKVAAVGVSERHGVTILGATTSRGHLDREYLGRTLKDSLAAGKMSFVVNLAGVRTVDALGVGALVDAHAACRAAGAVVRFAEPSERVREVLQVTRLDTALAVYETEESAVTSFTRDD